MWLRARAVTALVLAANGLALYLFWAWPGGLGISVLSATSCIDSMLRLRSQSYRDPLLSVWLDITAVFVGLSIANVPDSSIGIVFAYFMISTLILLPLSRGLPAMSYAAIWYVAVVRDWVFLGRELTESERIITGVISALIFVLAFAGMLTVLIQIMNRNALRQVRRSRLQQAIAEASNALLDDRGRDSLESALSALLHATDAASVFLDQNIEHPELGLCASLVIEVERDGEKTEEFDKWKLVPWSELSGREALAAGDIHAIRFSEMEGKERALYIDSDVKSELNIPIFVRGEWWGVIGFSHDSDEKQWEHRDEWLLFAAADMVGTYIERKRMQGELEGVIDDLDSQLRYQQALAECARLLQTLDEPSSVGVALPSLLDATDADLAYIHINFDHPNGGIGYRVVHEAGELELSRQAGASGLREGLYADTPTSFETLRAGMTSQLRISDLTGAERTIYENEGILAELRLPIGVSGEWRGSIAFADRGTERVWTDLEVIALEVASKMIASFWERTEAHDRLERMVDVQRTRLRYERAVAECSKALLTSDSEAAIDTALSHLMEATDTHKVFVDVNRHDREGGVIAVVANEVIRGGFEDIVDQEIWVDDEGITRHWELPYAQIPSLERKLSVGLPAVVIPRILDEEEKQAYNEDPLKTELNIPIFTRGEWVGSIGFADYERERVWRADEISLLQTIAEMISAFWERQSARRRLEELVRSKDAFVAAVSHELRTPLTSVVGLSSELRDRKVEFSQVEIDAFLEVIAEQSNEVADIVNDLLVAARADIGTLVIQAKTVELDTALESLSRTRILDDFSDVLIDNAAVRVVADPVRLNQVLRNLIVNAARYGGDTLRIDAAIHGRYCSIKVADNGTGVSEELIDHIFEPYGRAHEVPTQPESVGLGLAVARDLARLMDGDLEYTRTDGWTEFTLRLPSAEPRVRAQLLTAAGGGERESNPPSAGP